MNEPLNLSAAAERICAKKGQNAFFFMVGAGISRRSVPSAPEMIAEWKDRVRQAGRTVSNAPPASGGLDEYEFWFQQACDDRISRQDYLKEKIKSQLITPSNYKLARIICDTTLTNLAITTNFDTFLSRACGYLGSEPVVYDHPATVKARFREDSTREPAIIHLHGTWLHYDCANLRGEIEGPPKEMVSALDDILAQRSPLVIGYRGWEQDVFMSALRARLEASALPRNVYWFCYREAEIAPKPAWLRESACVFFVVPGTPIQGTHADGLAAERNSTAAAIPAEPTLTSDEVLQEIISTLRVPDSPLDIDPVTPFIQKLRYVISGLGDPEIEVIADTVKALRQNRREVDDVARLVAKTEWELALKAAAALCTPERECTLQPELQRELMHLVWTAVAKFSDQSDLVIKACEEVVSLGDSLRGLGRGDDAVSEIIAKALASKGTALLQRKQYTDAIAAFDEVLKRYSGSTRLELVDPFASSTVNKGIAICRKNAPKAPGPIPEQALALFDEVIDQYSDSMETVLRETVASAKVNKAYLLNEIGSGEQAQELYTSLIQDYGTAREPAIREHVARAMINMAYNYGRKPGMENRKAAIHLYQRAVSDFAEMTRPSMISKLALAWNGLGFQLLLKAKLEWKTDRDRAMATLDQALRAITTAGRIEPGSWLILGNRAYILFLLGQQQAAKETLDQALALGGADIRDIELDDVANSPITPDDDEFAGWLKTWKPEAAGAAPGGH
jgi:tetratricopeptide (TPR) repeat protein